MLCRADRRQCNETVRGEPPRLRLEFHVVDSSRRRPPTSRYSTSAADRRCRRGGWRRWRGRGWDGCSAASSTPTAGQWAPAARRPSAVHLRRSVAKPDPTHLSASARPRPTLTQSPRRTSAEASRRRLGGRQGRSPELQLST